MTAAAVEVLNLHAWYGDSHVLHGINLTASQGEVIALLGRAGSGRTTTLQAIRGLTDRRDGSIRIQGAESIHMPAQKIALLGIGYCPQEHGIFTGLSCEENLLLPPSSNNTLGGGMSLTEIYELFPNLEKNKHLPGTRLSGGEQHMLAVARILRTGVNLILLDEISEGQAPIIVHALAKMVTALKGKGYTIIMAEQNFHFTAPLADRFYVMDRGSVIEQVDSTELSSKQDVLNSFC